MSEKQLVQVDQQHVSISENFGYTPAEVSVIQNSVAKGTSKVELAYFINVCKSVGLNPFVKEIWCYKDNKGNLLVFAGRDGFLSKAQVNPNYAGLRSSEVCENDIFKMDIANNIIKHEPDYLKERGNIIGAYAIVFRKGGEPTIEWASFKVYNKGYNTWKTHPEEMIKKVAETHALKKAFGISGIQSEYDFEVKKEVAIPINSKELEYTLESLKDLYNEFGNLLSEDESMNIQRIIEQQEETSYKKAILILNKIK